MGRGGANIMQAGVTCIMGLEWREIFTLASKAITHTQSKDFFIWRPTDLSLYIVQYSIYTVYFFSSAG